MSVARATHVHTHTHSADDQLTLSRPQRGDDLGCNQPYERMKKDNFMPRLSFCVAVHVELIFYFFFF